MLPDQFKTGKEHIEDSIREADNQIAAINEKIQTTETDLAELVGLKEQFTQVKNNLLAEKQKLKAVPK